jgi:hypothetical protein
MLQPNLLEVQIEKNEDGSSVAHCIHSKALHIIDPVPSEGVMMQKIRRLLQDIGVICKVRKTQEQKPLVSLNRGHSKYWMGLGKLN